MDDVNPDGIGASDESFYDRLADFYETPVDRSDLKQDRTYMNQRYSEEKLIASGGMKQIFCVFDQKIGRYVALACLKKGSPKELREPFYREAKLTAKLDHPNIISIFDIGDDLEKGPYFTMELKTGSSFRKVLELESQKEVVQDNLEVLVKICDAVGYAHSKNVLHLDLKPDNIEIGAYGEVIVCDWGCGKIIDADEENLDHIIFNPDLLNQMTIVGKVRGTPGYMAPEQIEKGQDKNFQTDIYALGVMLYEVVYREPLYFGTQQERMDKTLKGNIKFPNGQLNLALNAMILKACQVKPDDRYSSVQDFKSDLQKYLRGYSPNAENANLLKLSYLFYKRNVTLCLSTLGFSILIVLSTFWYVINLNRSQKEAIEAKTIAEKQRQTALIYRSEAEKQLEILKNTKLRFSKGLHEDSRLLRKYYFDNPRKEIKFSLEKVNKALALKPYDHDMLRDKANMLFISQKYKAAHALYQRINFDNRKILELSKKFSDAPLSKNNLIGLENLKTILHNVSEQSWRRDFAEKILAYDYQCRVMNRNYESCVATLVNRYKPEGSRFEFHYNQDQGKLKIDSPELFRLTVREWSSGLCLLRFLKIIDLDISGTKISELSELKGLSELKSLNIVDTLVTDLSPLNDMKVSLLKLRKGQFSPSQLSQLNGSIKIVEIK